MVGKRALEILRMLLEAEEQDYFDGAEIVCEGGECWVDLERTSRAVVNELLRLCVIRDQSEQGKGVERYVLNEDGRKLAKDATYTPPIFEHLKRIARRHA